MKNLYRRLAFVVIVGVIASSPIAAAGIPQVDRTKLPGRQVRVAAFAHEDFNGEKVKKRLAEHEARDKGKRI